MNVVRLWRWMGCLVVLGCAPGTKSGGMIVDTDASEGSSEPSTGASLDDDSQSSTPTDPTDASTVGETTEDTETTDTGDTAQCIADAQCGNSNVEALEDCDGGPGCDACVATQIQTLLVDGGGIGPAVIYPDGSAVGITQSEKGELQLLRRWDEQGAMQWSVALEELETQIADVAVGDTGRIYVAGSSMSATQSDAIFHVFDDAGTFIWSAGRMGGSYSAIATREGRIVAAGGLFLEDGSSEAFLYTAVDQAEELWDVSDAELGWFMDVTFAGDGIATIAALPTPALVRYDVDGNHLWSVELPDDGAPDQKPWGVISDGGDGTWTFGQAAATPYAARHDADGNEIDVLDCIGGATGWVTHAAIGPLGALTLAIQLELHIDDTYEYHAWFPVIADGEVAFASGFSSDTLTAGPFAVGWRDDASRVLGWTNFGSEGGPGYSELVLAP